MVRGLGPSVPWDSFKLPPRWHFCRIVWSVWKGSYAEDRCACGATRTGGPDDRWYNKNERRKW